MRAETTECKALLADFTADRDHLAMRYQAWDKNYLDHDAAGAKTFQYHPKGLPAVKYFPTAAEFTSPTPIQRSPALRAPLLRL